MGYPEKFIRGVSCKDFVEEDGNARASAFQFGENVCRSGFLECSINWFDDEGAMRQIANQTKVNSSEYQFKIGAFVLDTKSLKLCCTLAQAQDCLSYERNPIPPDNVYHGNLLLPSECSPQIRANIRGMIAVMAGKVMSREELLKFNEA